MTPKVEYQVDRSRDLLVTAIVGGATLLLLVLLLIGGYGVILTVFGWVGVGGGVVLTTPFVVRAARRGPDLILTDEGLTVFRLLKRKFVEWREVLDVHPPRAFASDTPLAATVIPLSVAGSAQLLVPMPKGMDPTSLRDELVTRWRRAGGYGGPQVSRA